MCGLCFFVHVVEYSIAVAKTFIIITKTITISSINECNQNWMTFFSLFIYIFNENHINHKLLHLQLKFGSTFLIVTYAITTSCKYMNTQDKHTASHKISWFGHQSHRSRKNMVRMDNISSSENTQNSWNSKQGNNAHFKL